ncbi:putative 3-octaprenyl-4-hydroxybenzoate carboxy-lyase [Xylogone sp. PMI_703]|nr:putative 3-octaprenyl-4-hydroxybenzoate carboxy-lyase [Xylogone sp. PMI_703]
MGLSYIRSCRPLRKIIYNFNASPLLAGWNRAVHTVSKEILNPDAPTAQLDFRAFIDQLRLDNDLAEINQEVDPHLEVGAIVRRVSELNDKAPLFNNVKGAKNGLWRIFGNAASLRPTEKEKFGRIARNLGLPPHATWKEICDRWQAGKRSKPLPPNILATGPCKANKLLGESIDLTKLPAPLLHQDDGGKYIQTYGLHVLQTPDKSWTNWSIFRGMVHDKHRIVCLVGSGQHNSMIRDKWLAAGKTEIPWALAMGVPPIASIASAMPVPTGVSEAEYVGALAGQPLDLVKCELSDLLVPANSEIVMEGTFSLTEKAIEGPFEDYLGVVFENDEHLQPLFTVKAITYRDDAILPVSVPGRITDESHTTAALASAEILELCQQNNLPIKEAYAPLETHATWCALKVDIQKLADLKTNSSDFCRKLGSLVFNNKSSLLVNRLLLIGDDVDIQHFDDIVWAFATRCHPKSGEYVFDDVPGFFLSPYMSHGEGDPKHGGKTVSDCLLPMEYQGKRNFRHVDFESSYPEEIKTKVRANWENMGFVVSS